ncbi:MAG: hypothetical protein MJB57_00420 [Gemmatimonadetes bacterium]|nr:hypothetical protein [Gemmatimonadota bacterium]
MKRLSRVEILPEVAVGSFRRLAVAPFFFALLADPAIGQPALGTGERLGLSGLAKRYCSGIFVSEREREEMLTMPEDTCYAAGSHTQRVYIIPSRDLVIVTMSHRRGRTLSPDRAERMLEALGLAVKAVDPTWTWEPEAVRITG